MSGNLPLTVQVALLPLLPGNFPQNLRQNAQEVLHTAQKILLTVHLLSEDFPCKPLPDFSPALHNSMFQIPLLFPAPLLPSPSAAALPASVALPLFPHCAPPTQAPLHRHRGSSGIPPGVLPGGIPWTLPHMLSLSFSFPLLVQSQVP